MTIKEAIEIIKVERACVKRNTDNKCDRDCINCDLLRTEEEIFAAYDRAIESLEKAEKFQWVPVSERTPDDYGAVLLQYPNRRWLETEKRETLDIGYFDAFGNEELREGCENFRGEVIAWMPLPEPYKKEEE